MKTYDEYCKEYEETVKEGLSIGWNYAVKRHYFVTLNFFEDIGIPEPWAEDAPKKLKNALDCYSDDDKLRFMNDIEKTFKEFFG